MATYGNVSNMQLPWRPIPNLIAAHPIVLRVMYQGLLGASWAWIAWPYDTSVWSGCKSEFGCVLFQRFKLALQNGAQYFPVALGS